MNWKRHFIETATLIAAAVVCALISNAFASRERKLVVVSKPAQPAPLPKTTTVAPPPTATALTATQAPPMTPTPAKPAPLQPTKTVKAPVSREFDPHPDKPYIELHGDDVLALHTRGVLFLDARRTSVYAQGHIPNARPFSVWESDIDDKVNKLYAERPDPKDQNLPIVVYCSGGDCEDSHMLAQKLWGIGFNNAYVYKDGFPDWQTRGLPVHAGANP